MKIILVILLALITSILVNVFFIDAWWHWFGLLGFCLIGFMSAMTAEVFLD